jgi:large subunit ribosomal protein L23
MLNNLYMSNHFLIKRPIITEKAAQAGILGKYTFMVDKDASSAEIKKILKRIYNVDAQRVNIINVKPRMGRYGRVPTVKKPGYKKAIVSLKSGQTLDILPH